MTLNNKIFFILPFIITCFVNCSVSAILLTCSTNEYYNGSSCVACPSEYPESLGGTENPKTTCYNFCNGTTYYYNDGQTVPCNCFINSRTCFGSGRCTWDASLTLCKECVAGEYLDPNTAQCQSCATDTGGERPISPAGSVGIESCTASNCATGYYYNTTLNDCVQCTKPANWYAWTSAGTTDPNSCGFSCAANYYVNSDYTRCDLCSSLGDGSWASSPAGNINENGCYKECSRIDLTDDPTVVGYREPKNPTVNYSTNCSYKDADCTLAGYGTADNKTMCRACGSQYVSKDNSDYFEWKVAHTTFWALCPYTIQCKPNHEVVIDTDYAYTKLKCQPCATGHVLESGKNDFLTVAYNFLSQKVIGNTYFNVHQYVITSQNSQNPYTLYYYSNNGVNNTQITSGGSYVYVAPPTCVPGIYTITLNTNAPNGSDITNEDTRTKTIYLKYGEDWLASNDPSDELNGNIVVPTINTAMEFDGYWTEQTGGDPIIDAEGEVIASNDSFTSDVTLYARWTDGIKYKLVINNDITIENCRTDSPCSMSAFQNSCGTEFLDLANTNTNISTGTIRNTDRALNFTPNNTGIRDIIDSPAHQLTLNNITTNPCLIDSTCTGCIKTECAFNLASSSNTCSKTRFTNKTTFTDTTSTTYHLPLSDTVTAKISSQITDLFF
ncbi:MAG: hypothetical protein J6S74_00595 [Alphaproteobacteria bacterium]|nr:hypothetical protein [Alphaproteobacteria bacterium]